MLVCFLNALRLLLRFQRHNHPETPHQHHPVCTCRPCWQWLPFATPHHKSLPKCPPQHLALLFMALLLPRDAVAVAVAFRSQSMRPQLMRRAFSSPTHSVDFSRPSKGNKAPVCVFNLTNISRFHYFCQQQTEQISSSYYEIEKKGTLFATC